MVIAIGPRNSQGPGGGIVRLDVPIMEGAALTDVIALEEMKPVGIMIPVGFVGNQLYYDAGFGPTAAVMHPLYDDVGARVITTCGADRYIDYESDSWDGVRWFRIYSMIQGAQVAQTADIVLQLALRRALS